MSPEEFDFQCRINAAMLARDIVQERIRQGYPETGESVAETAEPIRAFLHAGTKDQPADG